MPMKVGLKFCAVVGLDDLDAEGETVPGAVYLRLSSERGSLRLARCPTLSYVEFSRLYRQHHSRLIRLRPGIFRLQTG